MNSASDFVSHFTGFEIYATVPDSGEGGFFHYHESLANAEPSLRADNAQGRGVFFTVNDLDCALDLGRKRTKKMFVRARAVWVEDDQRHIGPRADWPIPPNLIVNSSPGKYHYYWLTTCGDAGEWEAVMARMVRDHGCDNQARDLARVLRLPGFMHQKAEPHLVTFAEGRAEPYDWLTITQHFPPLHEKHPRAVNGNCVQPGMSIAELLQEAEGGHQHGPSRALAMKLANYGMPRAEALAIMHAVLPNQHHDGHHEQSLDTALAKVAIEDGEWPELTDLPDPLPSVPTLAPSILPDAFRPWLQDVAERMGCPLDFLGAGALVSLGAVVGRQIGIRPQEHDDWTVVPNLWGAVIGRPGVMKSPALSEVMRPLHEIERDAKDRQKVAMREHEANKDVREAVAKIAGKKIEKALLSGSTDEAMRIALDARGDGAAEPTRERIVTNDTTVEKLGELLSVNPRGVLVFRDELSGWFKSLEREGQEGARAFFLESWNGTGRFTFDRVGRGTVDIDSAVVSVLGGIQPGPLAAYLQGAVGGGAGDDGLLQRLQVAVWPDSPKEWKECDRPPNKTARDAAFAVFHRLDKVTPMDVGAHVLDGIPHLRFDTEAQQVWRSWREKLEHRIRVFDGPAAFEAVLAKQRSLVPSIALLLHLADRPEGGPVTVDALKKAIRWAEYLEAHAARLYAPVLQGKAIAARELAKRIKAGKLPSVFQVKTVADKGWSGLTDTDAVRKALEELAGYGWVRRVEHKRTGGRPREDWELRPHQAQYRHGVE